MSDVHYSVTVSLESNIINVQANTRPEVRTASIRGLQGVRGEVGADGKSAYEVALDNGFVGTEVEWIETLKGSSAYQVAIDNGFVGTEEEWLESLRLKASPQDFGKILTNDGSDTGWVSIEDILNSNEVVWDLGEI